ncbi:hypothetical protein A2U01_0056415, partial [Trifolium medium]|nr:hypothetical protein [Trifolium medium]
EELDPTPNSKIVSESSPRSARPPAIRFLIGSSTIYICAPSPTVLGARGCVKRSPTWVARWPKSSPYKLIL